MSDYKERLIQRWKANLAIAEGAGEDERAQKLKKLIKDATAKAKPKPKPKAPISEKADDEAKDEN